MQEQNRSLLVFAASLLSTPKALTAHSGAAGKEDTMAGIPKTGGWLVIAAGMGLFVAADTCKAQEKKSPSMDARALDKAVFDVLRDIGNQGADLFNKHVDYAGCYRVYQGGLTAVKPFLAHRPNLQKVIDDGIARANKKDLVWERAFALRQVLDQVRTEVSAPVPRTKAKQPGPAIKKGLVEDLTVEPATKAPRTLWERLGGEKGVSKFVQDFARMAADDPAVNFTRGGRFKPNKEEAQVRRRKFVEYISSVAGGPLRYKGRTMKESHRGMAITDAEFDATLAVMKKALEKNGIHEPEVGEFLRRMEATRRDIVAPAPAKTPAKKDVQLRVDPEVQQAAARAKESPASLSGTIHFRGRPVRAYVTFIAQSDRRHFSTYVHPGDGRYFFRTPIPAGMYLVELEPAAKGVVIPDRYRSVATSGLVVEVRSGVANVNLELQD
jgi:hemoglobin